MADNPANPELKNEGVGKSGVSLTDEEVICTFMERRPDPNTHGGTFLSGGNWWYWYGSAWLPCSLTLDALWKVERRLTLHQWQPYVEQLLKWKSLDKIYVEQLFWMTHATVEQKIRALAATLRSRVLSQDEADGSTGLKGERR